MTWILGLIGWGGAAALVAALALGVVLSRKALVIAAAVVAVALLAWGVLGYVQASGARTALNEAKTANALVLQDIAQKTSEAHKAALEAERAVAASEKALSDRIQQITDEGRKNEQAHQARIADAARIERGLRGHLESITRRYASACAKADAATAAAGVRTSEACAIGVLAELLGREQRRAATFAREADESRAAGLICERAYDAARQAGSAG